MKNKHSELLGIIVVASLSCSSPNDSEPVIPSRPFVPLSAGNSWFFARNSIDSLGNTISTQFDTLIIKADTTIDGTLWFGPASGYLWPINGPVCYRNTDSGIVVRLLTPNANAAILMQSKYPSQVGDSYRYPTVLYNGPTAFLVDTLVICQVTSVDTLVTVPAGSFHCVKYTLVRYSPYWFGEADQWNIYVSPGFGWIRVDFITHLRPGGKVFLISSSVALHLTLR